MLNTLAARGEEGRVLVSEIFRRADKQALTRKCPNGATLLIERLKTL